MIKEHVDDDCEQPMAAAATRGPRGEALLAVLPEVRAPARARVRGWRKPEKTCLYTCIISCYRVFA